jgi:hypothetical protein
MTTPPPRLARLPVDQKGRPVPWFVAWINDQPDFRIVAAGKVEEAVRFNKCFLCGEPLGRWLSFAVGPMSVINGTAPEPPAHKECAAYAVIACPFLARPTMRRRSAGLPEGLTVAAHAPGATAAHNPGVTAIWTTRSQTPFPDGKGGLLLRMGPMTELVWYAEARPATRAEVLEALAAERDALLTHADAAEHAAIEAAYTRALALAPAS